MIDPETMFSPADRTWLAECVRPANFTPEAIETHRAAFSRQDVRLHVIPDFLTAGVAERIAEFLATEAEFTERFAVLDDEGAHSRADDGDHRERLVSEAEWDATSADRRFLRFSVGPGQPSRMSVGWMRYLSLHAALQRAPFASYVQAVTGLALGSVSSLTAHAMRAGDMLAPHSDANHRRRLAFILYFSRHWHTAFGGALLVTHLDGQVTRIEPSFNTLVVFDVLGHRSHYVEPIHDAAGAARRLSIGGWFDHPAAGHSSPLATSTNEAGSETRRP